jgi:cell division protein ZapA (FtsZ GTPase activity inhibitor)
MKYKVAHWMNDISRNNEVFKINSSSRIHLDRAARLLDGYINHRNEHFRILKFQYVALAALKVLVISGLLIAGSVLVVRNELNLGQFISSEI